MYQIEKLVSTSHVGTDSKLTLTAAVDFMQDCSFFQINSVNGLMEEFADRNMAMFVISRQMDILDMPKFGDHLIVRTWVWELNRIFGSRNTVIYDDLGNPRVISYAMGSFVNLDNGRPGQVSEKILNEILIEERFEMEYLPRKIELPALTPIPSEHVSVLKSHLDNYNHVNNSKYVMIAYEYLPQDFIVKRMRVEYKTPAKYGDIFSPVIYKDVDKYIISLNNTENKPFAVVEFCR